MIAAALLLSTLQPLPVHKGVTPAAHPAQAVSAATGGKASRRVRALRHVVRTLRVDPDAVEMVQAGPAGL